MNTSSFARIRNAKPLLLTEEKRVMHFPATNKVRIDNNVNYEPRYRKEAEKYSRQEYINADKASQLGVVPAVQNYRERGNLHSYTQDYGGNRLPEQLEGMSAKQQYKLGSQVGRIQNKLLTKGLGHADLHEGNIVRPNPKRNQVKLIDNDSIKNIKDEYDKTMMKSYYMPQAFNTGYNSRINFTQHRQMQHFADFGFEQLVGQAKNLGKQGLSYIDKHPVRSAAGITAAAGALKGTGVFETEEERTNTTGLGRLGKLATNSALGAAVGTGGMVINQKASQLGAQAAQKYKRGSTPDPYTNPARQSGQAPTQINID